MERGVPAHVTQRRISEERADAVEPYARSRVVDSDAEDLVRRIEGQRRQVDRCVVLRSVGGSARWIEEAHEASRAIAGAGLPKDDATAIPTGGDEVGVGECQ